MLLFFSCEIVKIWFALAGGCWHCHFLLLCVRQEEVFGSKSAWAGGASPLPEAPLFCSWAEPVGWASRLLWEMWTACCGLIWSALLVLLKTNKAFQLSLQRFASVAFAAESSIQHFPDGRVRAISGLPLKLALALRFFFGSPLLEAGPEISLFGLQRAGEIRPVSSEWLKLLFVLNLTRRPRSAFVKVWWWKTPPVILWQVLITVICEQLFKVGVKTPTSVTEIHVIHVQAGLFHPRKERTAE